MASHTVFTNSKNCQWKSSQPLEAKTRTMKTTRGSIDGPLSTKRQIFTTVVCSQEKARDANISGNSRYWPKDVLSFWGGGIIFRCLGGTQSLKKWFRETKKLSPPKTTGTFKNNKLQASALSTVI